VSDRLRTPYGVRDFGYPDRGTLRYFGYFCSVENDGMTLDPVCDMVVSLADQRDQGLTIERPEREYAFCGAGCLQTFAKDPKRYIPKVERWLAAGESAPPRM
jgi:YHS domain-containing protein